MSEGYAFGCITVALLIGFIILVFYIIIGYWEMVLAIFLSLVFIYFLFHQHQFQRILNRLNINNKGSGMANYDDLGGIFNDRDLSKMNLQEVYDRLMDYVTEPEAFTMWGRRRQIEKVNLYIEKINRLKELGIDIEKLNASFLTHNDRMQHFVDLEKHEINMGYGKMEADKKQGEYNISLAEEEFREKIREINFTRKNKKQDLKDRMTQDEKEHVYIDDIRANTYNNLMREKCFNNLTNAKTAKEYAFAKFIDKVLSNLSIVDFPPAYQSFIISSIFNPNGNQYNNLDEMEKIKNFVERDREAKTKTAEAEAMRKEHEAEQVRIKKEKDEIEKEQMEEKLKRDKNKRESNEQL
ncbi:MAG: DUF2273 domain-containing protein [bacterium]